MNWKKTLPIPNNGIFYPSYNKVPTYLKNY